MDISELAVNKVEKKKLKEEKSILERDIQLFPHKITDKEKAVIYRQLDVLQRSGVDIKTSFDILFKQIKNKKSKAKLETVLEEVIRGRSLPEAFGEVKDFTPYEVFSLKIGEETGKLSVVLEKLTQYFENKIAQRRQIVSALSYPILIVLTSFAAVTFMIFFIIPMFEEVFLRFGSELPALTKWVIGISKLLKGNAMYFLGFIGVLVALFYYFRDNLKFIRFREKVWLKTPVAGEIYRQVYIARFCDSMGLLILSSVPMMNALEMIKKMIGFQHIEETVEKIKKDLIQGRSFTQALEKHKIFDDQMKALIKVGEEVNQLGPFFQKLSQDYTESVKHRTSLLSTFLEPIMIIFLGLVVGLILMAMYLPMFELSSGMEFGG